jgi:hypothetical protein
MRIETHQESQPASPGEGAGSAPPGECNCRLTGRASTLCADQSQLSIFHLQIQPLVARVCEFPETAQGKVEALRQAVISGIYRPTPDQVAAALLSNMVVKLAA